MTRRREYDVAFYVPSVTPLLTRAELLPPGGAETQVFLLTRALARAGARVALVAFDAPGVELPKTIDGVDIVVRPPYRAHQPLVGKIREAIRIYRVLRRIDTHVVVTRVAGPHVGLVGLSARLARRRFVQSSANISDFDFQQLSPKPRDMALYRLGMRLADRIVVQTEEQVPLCEQVFGKRPVLIKSIAEEAERSSAPRRSLLWIGRLVWYKRPLAFVELAKSLPDVRFRMIGVPSTSDPELAEQVAAAAAEVPNLELLPPRTRPELLAALEGSVAVVNTAEFEGMPNIFLEGWARGIPALALTHDPGGVIETYGLGRFAHGSPEALRRGAEELWALRDDAEALAAACRRYIAEQHGARVVTEQWLDALGLRAHPGLAVAVPEAART